MSHFMENLFLRTILQLSIMFNDNYKKYVAQGNDYFIKLI